MTIAIASPRFIRIGAGAIGEVSEVLQLLGVTRPLLVVDPHFRGSAQVAALLDALTRQGQEPACFYGVVPDPTTHSIDEAVAVAKGHGADGIVALGGGSAIDTGKGAALLSRHDRRMGALRAPYRVVETGLPLVAVPTTAGTGSEATRFCLVTDSDTGEKMVCIGEGFMPSAAVVDYELTLSVPPRLAADTGIDAFTHALESFVGHKANAFSNLYAAEALRLIARGLPQVWTDAADREARSDVMRGSLMAGIAFSNSGLGLAHAMSAPFGAIFHVPHAVAIGMLLPAATRFSIEGAPAPYAAVARLLGLSGSHDDADAAARFADWLDALVRRLEVPAMSAFGIDRNRYFAAIEAMAAEAPRSGAAANNPRPVSVADIATVFEAAWR